MRIGGWRGYEDVAAGMPFVHFRGPFLTVDKWIGSIKCPLSGKRSWYTVKLYPLTHPSAHQECSRLTECANKPTHRQGTQEDTKSNASRSTQPNKPTNSLTYPPCRLGSTEGTSRTERAEIRTYCWMIPSFPLFLLPPGYRTVVHSNRTDISRPVLTGTVRRGLVRFNS